MRNKNVENLLSDAIDILKEVKVVNENGVYEKGFKGHISSFGASIVQSGLLPTLLFFEDTSSESNYKAKIPVAILTLMKKHDENIRQDKLSSLFLTVNDNKYDKYFQLTVDCAIALKLALRVYKPEK